MVAIKTGHHYRYSAAVARQEHRLLSIDYAQGESDLNFVFFFAASRGRRRLPIGCIRESLFKAVEQFPVLLGRLVDDTDSDWRIVVDPEDINWPLITEARARGHTIAGLQRAGFKWSQWPPETQLADLRTHDSKPMMGVHIVHYDCGGISLHTKVRHQAMDGNGVWRFYHAWSSICFSECRPHHLPPHPVTKFVSGNPLHDRQLLLDRLEQPKYTVIDADTASGTDSSTDAGTDTDAGTESDADADTDTLAEVCAVTDTSILVSKAYCNSCDEDNYIAGLMRFFEDATKHQPCRKQSALEDYKLHRFVLSKSAITQLKHQHGKVPLYESGDKYRANIDNNHEQNTKCTAFVSTNDLICALFWRAIARAHHRAFPDDPYTCIMLACDVRGRIGAPLTYNGNASFPLLMHMSKSQLLRQTVTETAMHIRRHIGMVTPRFVRHMMNFMASEASMQRLIAMFHPDRAFFSASIVSGFPMFGMSNFGFGRPAHIDIPAYLTPGFSIWMPTRRFEQPICVNLALTHSIFALIEKDTEFRQYVDITL